MTTIHYWIATAIERNIADYSRSSHVRTTRAFDGTRRDKFDALRCRQRLLWWSVGKMLSGECDASWPCISGHISIDGRVTMGFHTLSTNNSVQRSSSSYRDSNSSNNVSIHRVRKTWCHFIFDYKSRISRSIFIIYEPLWTRTNTPQPHVINLLNSMMSS